MTLLHYFFPTLNDIQGSVRRSGTSLITTICKYYPHPAVFQHVLGTLKEFLLVKNIINNNRFISKIKLKLRKRN